MNRYLRRHGMNTSPVSYHEEDPPYEKRNKKHGRQNPVSIPVEHIHVDRWMNRGAPPAIRFTIGVVPSTHAFRASPGPDGS